MLERKFDQLVSLKKTKQTQKQWKWTLSINDWKTNSTDCRCLTVAASFHLPNDLPSFCCTDEHDAVQKKTFTKWINAQFSKVIYMHWLCSGFLNFLLQHANFLFWSFINIFALKRTIHFLVSLLVRWLPTAASG